jgi:glycosyltransferase involved in cell wall biosynthesis
MSEWLIVSPALPGRFDGIGDYSWNLARALSASGPAHVIARSGDAGPPPEGVETVASWRGLGRDAWRRRARAARGILVQYAPHAFLRGDLRPLLSWLDEARLARCPVVLTVHEYWPPADGSLRRAARRAVYLRLLKTVVSRSTHIVVTQQQGWDALTDARLLMPGAATMVPVGSNIERRGDRSEPADPSLVLFGQPANWHEPTMAAFGAWLRSAASPPRVTWMNRSSEDMRASWCDRLGLPESLITLRGALAADAVSAELLGASIGLAPYVNGASTRRTTFVSMLQHGLPVVGLDGGATSETLRASGAIAFSPEGDPESFVRQLVAVMGDRDRRMTMSRAAEHLFEAHLSWPCIARSYLAAVGSPPA